MKGFQRNAIFITIIVYALIGFLDFYRYQGELLNNFLILRYLIVLPIVSILIVLSYTQRLKNKWQLLSNIIVGIVVISVIIINVFSPIPISYFNSHTMMLILIYSSVVLRMRFLNTFVTGLSLVVLYSFIGNIFIDFPIKLFLYNVFFLVTTFVLTCVASYITELNSRRNYFLQMKLEQEKENVRLILENEIESNKMKSKFINITSHVFRNPLTSLIGSIQVVGDFLGYKDIDSAVKYNQYSRKSADEILNILNRIQFLIKYQAGEIVCFPNGFDIREMIKSFLLKNNKFNVANHKFLLNLHEGEVFFVVDRSLLDTMLSEIIANAIKFSPDQSEIIVETELVNDDLSIRISDQGDGFDFSLFNNSEVEAFNFINDGSITGLGLGFVMIKATEELLNAKVSYEANQPNGTKCNILIPKNVILK
jgi:signal transduction histidine kinase